MGVTWRDALAAVLVALAVLVTIALVAGWGLPLIGDAVAGGIAVLVIGFAACVVGGGPTGIAAMLKPGARDGTGVSFLGIGSVLALLTTGLLVAVIVLNSITLLVWATIALAALWVVTTAHHAIEQPHEPVRTQIA